MWLWNFKVGSKMFVLFTECKRIRKPSKRLIEWTEEYDQLFSTKKKAKKKPESFTKVAQFMLANQVGCGSFLVFCNLLYIFGNFLNRLKTITSVAQWRKHLAKVYRNLRCQNKVCQDPCQNYRLLLQKTCLGALLQYIQRRVKRGRCCL